MFTSGSINKKVVFFPVEIESRELDYKILLASMTANSEVCCFIGQHNLLNKLINFFKNGVYFGKNVFQERFPCDQSHYQALKKNKFSLLYFNEEGGVLSGGPPDWDHELKAQIDPKYLDSDDAILCWGQYQYNFYSSLPAPQKPSIYNTGCPRLELNEGSSLKELVIQNSSVSHQNFILFNTNFAAVNHSVDPLTWFENYSRKDETMKHMNTAISIYADSMKVLGSFIEMILAVVNEFPTKTFYLRPHPSESLIFYQTLFAKHHNISVVRDATAVEWIQSCDLLIQNGCSTSLEAHFLDKKIISYYPFDNQSNVNITKGIGVSANSSNQVIKKIETMELSAFKSEDLSGISKLISNFEQSTSFQMSHNIILSSLSDKIAIPFSILKVRAYTIFHTTFIRIKSLIGRGSSKKRKIIQYLRLNFPGFDPATLQEKIDIVEKILNKKLIMTYINKDLFIISEQSASNREKNDTN